MSCALTEYRRPSPRYGLRTLAARTWRTRDGWMRLGGWDWGRVYVRRRRRVARRARVYRADGWWKWRVEEFDLGTGAVRGVVARSAEGKGYASPAAAFPFADLAARS